MALFPLGILSAAGAGGADLGSDYELIETVILGSSQSSVTFSSLGTYSSTYKHLQIRYAGTMDTVNRWWGWQANGDTGTNYRTHQLYGDSGSVTSMTTLQNLAWTQYAWDNNTTNQPVVGVIDFLDAFSTTKNKVSRSLSGGPNSASPSHISLASGLWLNTASITSLTVALSGSGNFRVNSRFSLYGIK